MNLYLEKHTIDETELCNLEKKCLFGVVTDKNYFFTEEYIDVDRSPFVKYCLKNVSLHKSLEDLIAYIIDSEVKFDEFKIMYLDILNDMKFDERHIVEGKIGYYINGFANVSNPSIILGVTRVDGEWVFGEYIKSKIMWLTHMNRPQEYCNAISTRVARAIVNISVGNNMNVSVVDPCCGVGTVVIEAASMGINVSGYDINPNVIAGSRKNLKYFDYNVMVEKMDIHELKGHYDNVILDLPYGLLSIANINTQHELIKRAITLGDNLTLISLADMEHKLKDFGLDIVDSCVISKGNFKRNLYVCTKKINM